MTVPKDKRGRFPRTHKLAPDPTPRQREEHAASIFARGDLLYRDKTKAQLRAERKNPNLIRPASFKNLKPHLTGFAKTSLIQRCHKCGRVAVRGTKNCWFHGGAIVVTLRDLTHGYGVSKYAVRGAAAKLLKETNALPPELRQLPVFQAVSAKFKTDQNALAVMRELIMGWLAMSAGDGHEPWINALNNARKAGYF